MDKQFALSGTRLFTGFFWTYNLGLVLTAAMMVVHGSLTVLGRTVSPAVSGIAGVGHLVITIGFALFFACMYSPVVHGATGDDRPTLDQLRCTRLRKPPGLSAAVR
ncbi:DUF2871 family protein [Nocardia niigatensis]|uniref:DUF2871 family protein n=1 Tax=Nocardia niigatensis TaxID=209249 RepID=UPI0002D8A524|nr:DUF2871 family protein [Nocardia niigatensis]